MHSGKPAVSAVLLALLCLTLFSLAGCASSQSPQGPVPASSALPQQEAGDASSVFVEVKSSDNSFNSDLASLVASTLQSDHGINPADSRKEADITIDITVNDVYLAASSGRRISGSQALGIVSAQQRLLAAILREPRYLELAKQQLTAEQFIQPQQKELYEAMLNCSREGVELSLTALRAFVSEEALNELSRLAAQYSDVNCTPEDIHLYLDRIARGMPVASKAAAMSGDEITQYLQSMREKKQGTLPEQD